MRHRLRCHFAAFFVAFIVLGPIIYMLMDREVPFERVNGEVQPADPRAGSMIQVRWEGRTKRYCAGLVLRWITDSEGVIWSLGETTVVSNDVKQGDTTIRTGRSFRLPTQIAPGPAAYRSVVRSICNPLHHWWPIVYTSPEIPFTVTPRAH